MAHSTGPRPDQATRDAVTERIFAHARQRWPRIEVLVRHSGAFCYVAVLEPARTRRRHLFTTKPDEHEPFPVLRLRYHPHSLTRSPSGDHENGETSGL